MLLLWFSCTALDTSFSAEDLGELQEYYSVIFTTGISSSPFQGYDAFILVI